MICSGFALQLDMVNVITLSHTHILMRAVLAAVIKMTGSPVEDLWPQKHCYEPEKQ